MGRTARRNRGMLMSARRWTSGQMPALAVLICCLLLPRSTRAQEAQNSPASGSQAPQVETVVVTAERRTQDLHKTSIAAIVLTGDDLKHKGVNTLDQLQFTT